MASITRTPTEPRFGADARYQQHQQQQPGLELDMRREMQAGLEVRPDQQAPEVLGVVGQKEWEEDEVNKQGQQHQFYAGYPSPGGYEPSSTAAAPYSPAGWDEHQQHQQHRQWSQSGLTQGTSSEQQPPHGVTILGIRRRKFWLIFGPLLALLVIGLAIGLGVGLGTSSSSSSSPSPTPTSILCPADDGTVYKSSSGTSFDVLCSIDYNSGGGTDDLGNEEADDATACADLCAQRADCEGAGYGDVGQGTRVCYLKGSLGASQTATPEWTFLMRQQ